MSLELLPGSYCGEAPGPDLVWASWNFDPVVLAALLTLTIFLRHKPPGLAAVAVLAVAFVSPLCALSVGLFSARVVHHVLLVAVAAPLLAAALPRRRLFGSMPLHFLVSTAILWAWHLPAAYDLALRDIGVYWMMQVTLLGSATLFWRAVLANGDAVGGVLWSMAGLIQMGLLGAILTLAPVVLYDAHQQMPLQWGLMPLEDQQLGGLIMWVPAMLPYIAVLALLARRAWNSGRGPASA
ncbi:MAG: cytochrome c oxidase assembly protein [Roseovarius sp.]|uniref:cytochrome c oxidase assembly protein n=1 Tax=Roseovarius sp. TaxID=1486281 RepID=UPI0032EDE4E4